MLVAVWPEDKVNSSEITYIVQEVIDGNTIKLENGTTVHLIGVNNTNEGKDALESMIDHSIYLVADYKWGGLYVFACLWIVC